MEDRNNNGLVEEQFAEAGERDVNSLKTKTFYCIIGKRSGIWELGTVFPFDTVGIIIKLHTRQGKKLKFEGREKN